MWYLVLEHDRPRFTPGFTCPVLLGNSNLKLLRFRVRDYHTLWSSFPGAFLYRFAKIIWLPQHPDKSGFRLFPFRSPLLRESHSFYFPPGTKMFQFPGLPGRAKRGLIGFLHSDTPGSKLVWQLPEAYRNLLRPSSATSPKASTESP